LDFADIQIGGQTPLAHPHWHLAHYYDTDRSLGTILEGGQANYVYLRAKCSRPVEMDTRLFCIPNELMLYPQLWARYSVQDMTDGDNKRTAIRRMSCPKAGAWALLDPFNVFDPPSPGSSGKKRHHYCLIAEAKRPGDKDWPHEDAPQAPADLYAWKLNNPHLIQRNMFWKDYTSHSEIVWEVGLTIPNFYSSTDVFSIDISCVNAPVGGFISLTCTGNANFNVAELQITQPNINFGSATVTGLHLPYEITATIKWRQGRGGKPAPGATFDARFNQHSSKSGFGRLPEGSPQPLRDFAFHTQGEEQPHRTYVGPSYPHLKEGGFTRNSRHEHLNGQSLIGDAFPMPRMPGVGTHENIHTISFRSKIGYIEELGGDQIHCQTKAVEMP